MKKIYGILTLVIFIAVVVISVLMLSKHKPIEVIKLNGSEGKVPVDIAAELPMSDTVSLVNDFGFSLFKNMIKERENILICPPSMYQASSVLFHTIDSKYKAELFKDYFVNEENVLEVRRLLLNTSNIDITNSLWINEDFKNNVKKDYSDLLGRSYFTKFSAVDFSKPLADVTMNDFVYSSTNGVFDRAVEAQNIENNNMFLINTATATIDFANQFDFRNNKKGEFTIADRINQVYMLNKKDKLLYAENNLLTFVTFPLAKNNWDLHIIMPKENLNDTVNFLSGESFSRLLNLRQEKNVELFVPQLNIQMQKSNVATAMQKLNMSKVFDKKLADFGSMFVPDKKGFYADNIIHKTALVENTVVSSNNASKYSGGELTNFTADRPFIIVITDRKTGVCNFIGFIYNPS